MGITGPKLCTEKIASHCACATRNGDGGAEDRVLARVVNVLRQQHDHQLAVAAEHQVLVFSSIATFMLASRSFRLATTSSISVPRHRRGMNRDLAGIQARRGQQARGQLASRPVCSSISATSSACPGERWPISPRPVWPRESPSAASCRRAPGCRARWRAVARCAARSRCGSRWQRRGSGRR
jgi:hypothetical protein